ncbi:MAG: hypothetical protein HUU35_03430, partial [Armatimonadetes bacterium]|nr:hypothetical protein [Armatimonadota bacterium]
MAWRASGVAPEAQPMLRLLAEEYPLRELHDGVARVDEVVVELVAEANRLGFAIERREGLATVRYGRLCDAGRALGTLLAGLVGRQESLAEAPAFATLGICLDCGHNATIKPAHLRVWLRRLVLLGFNAAMLYTEAGYRLPDEPCFGYLRGTWSADALRALDTFASSLGIELIGGIQALGHLEQLLKWPAYASCRDTEHTLLVGEPRTTALVEKMVAHWASVFRSRRLHLGMDETYDLGRGGALDRYGYRPGLELYTEHLAQVVEICRQQGLQPLIWSDVLFRLAGSGGGHYAGDKQSVARIAAALPAEVGLVYWDYYSPEAEHYRQRIELHRALGAEPMMASGVWSWPNFWHDQRSTERNAGACIEACRAAEVSELLFTLWSDDGAFWELDSNLAGLAWVAERCHGDGQVNDSRLARRFGAVCGGDWALHRTASRINEPLQSCCVIWDDPLLAIYLRHIASTRPGALAEAEQHYLAVAQALEPHRAQRAGGDLNHAWLVARLLATKVG